MVDVLERIYLLAIFWRKNLPEIEFQRLLGECLKDIRWGGGEAINIVKTSNNLTTGNAVVVVEELRMIDLSLLFLEFGAVFFRSVNTRLTTVIIWIPFPPQSNWIEVTEQFDDMALKDPLLCGLYAYGLENPSAVQQRAIIPLWEYQQNPPYP